jgi:hypothetical protein
MPPTINLATSTFAELLAAHNAIAPSRGVPPLPKRWTGTHVELAKKLALLRAARVVPLKIVPTDERGIPAPVAKIMRRAPTPVRTAVLRSLAVISYFEHRKTGEAISKRRAKKFDRAELVSVGLPYVEVLRRVRRRVPHSKIDGEDLRWYATMVRQQIKGFEHGKLPQKRPHGMKGVKIKHRAAGAPIERGEP